MTDDEFVRAFESCSLPEDAFHHRDHIRLARVYLAHYGIEAATARFVEFLRRYAAHLGKSGKYHETMTVAWIHLVAHGESSIMLLDKNYIGQFYSPELLASDLARQQFVEPDLAPLPR